MSSKDQEENKIKDEATNISSKTVVKYVEPKLNISNNYVKLAEKTNLNLPPSNWLKEFLPGSFTPQLQRSNPINYASLFMAGKYPEMFTEVDVVSSSKHIKKLLKTPFNSNTSYSMSVHRIGNSLFLNDLDIPALLKSNQFKDEKLGWLLDLYCSVNNFSNDREIYLKKKNKELSQQQMIESKFMYYSIENEPSDEKPSETTKGFRRSNSICGPELDDQAPPKASVDASASPLSPRKYKRSDSLCGPSDTPNQSNQPSLSTTNLTSTAQESNIPAPFSNDFPAGSFFMRDVVWTFEDITMLVGSDLPIFGEGRYPAVSLRLRDASKPINVLTGMDYWLDNLMCNVPELMMCYHLNGIVQKYEKIKTAELPFLEGSQFSPKIIKDVAQNILSFLKSNCTKEGHTYWLFKSSKEDVVKLYDLTSIAQENESPDPFGSSVGFLLYQIAFNMYTTLERTDHNILKMVALLENCIKIFQKERCNELLAMANFLLSDLYAQSLTTSTSTIDTSNSTEHDCSSTDSSYATDDESVDSNDSLPLQSSIDVKTLFEDISMKRSYEKYEYMNKNLDEEEKCKNSIQAVTKVLLLLFDLKDPVNPHQVLPFTGRQINESLLSLPEMDSSNRALVKPFNKDLMKARLLSIIAKCYLTLVRISLSKEKFGRTLRFLNITFKSLLNLKEKYLNAQALMYYGDVITMLASSRNLNVDLEKEEYLNFTKEDKNLLEFLDSTNTKENEFFCNIDISNLAETFDSGFEELLLLATDVYQESYNNFEEKAVDSQNAQAMIDITRRHANICNELGVLYMNRAATNATRYGVPSDSEIKLWKISYSHFEKGIKAFDLINDRANVALLYSNTGKLMRLCAQVYGNSTKSSVDGERGQFTQQEETYFNKAFEFYNKGLTSLSSGEVSPQIKNSLLMELAGAHLSIATLMQDNAPLQSMAEEKVVKQISSSLMKSLHYMESIPSADTKDENHIQKQIGTIHQKLGSLYHHVLRNQISDSGKKNYRSLAELHYFRAYNHCNPKLNPVNFIQIIMEHLALYDYLLAQNQSPKSLKSKHRLLFEDEIPIRDAVSELCSRVEREKLGAGEKEEVNRLLSWLFGQLSRTLKETIKYMNGKIGKSFNHLDIGNMKKMFEAVIRGNLPNDLKNRTNGMKNLLVLLNQLNKKDVKS